MANAKTLVYQIDVLGTDTAKLSVQQLIDRQKELKKLLAEIPAASTDAYKALERELEDSSGGTKELESELEKLKQQYQQSSRQIQEFNNSLKDSQKEEEKAARAAELLAQRKADAEQKASDKILDTLRRKAEEQSRVEKSSSVEGLETLRQEEIAKLQAIQEFSQLELHEQEKLIAQINARYERETEKLEKTLKKENPVAGSTNALRKRLIELNRELDNTAHTIDGQVNPEFERMTREAHDLTQELSQAEQASGRFQRNVGNYPDIGKSITEGFNNIGPSLIGAFAIGNVADLAVQGLKDVLVVGAEFEKSVSNLGAITGATGKDLEFFSEEAQRIGTESALGASKTAEAFKLIGSAKPDLLSSKEALIGVTESAILLARAATIELPEAATNLTDVLNQFGKAGESTESILLRSKAAVDVLAAGAKYGSVEIDDTAASVLKFGSAANSLGIDVKGAVAIVQTLGPTIKGAEQGTAIKSILGKLAVSGKGMKDGVLDIKQALEELAPIQDDVVEVQKIFGQNYFVVAQALIKNRDALGSYIDKLGESGVAAEQARINVDNLAGDQEKLNAAVEGLELTIFAQLRDEARGTTQTFTKLVEYIQVGLKDGLDDLLNPAKEIIDAFGDLFSIVSDLFSVFGATSKEGNALGTIMKVLGFTTKLMLTPLRLLLSAINFIFGGIVSLVEGIKGFIDQSPILTAVVDTISGVFSTLGNAVGAVTGFFSNMFGDAVPKIKSNTTILIEAFGSLEGAAEALRTELGATKDEYNEFVAAFDKTKIEGKGIQEARQIVEQEFNDFLKAKRTAQDEAIDESQLALLKQVKAEEDLQLEKSAKGLEILRKRRQDELKAEAGFAKLSKGQQLLLLEKIDKDINAKKKALRGTAAKDDTKAALEALRKRIEKLKEAELAQTQEGLVELRALRLAELEKEKGFAKLAEVEKAVLRAKINDDIDKQEQGFRDARFEKYKSDLANEIKLQRDSINNLLANEKLGMDAAQLSRLQLLDEQEQERLAKVGDKLQDRLDVQAEFDKKREDLEEEYQAKALDKELEAVEAQLQVAKLSAEEILALEQEAQKLRAEIYDIDKQNLIDVEEKKRDELRKTAELQKELAEGIMSITNDVTAIIQEGAQERIAAIEAENDRRDESYKDLVERTNEQYELQKATYIANITDQAQLAEALANLELQRDEKLLKLKERSAEEQKLADEQLAKAEERRQRAAAFQKKADALEKLASNARILRNNAEFLSNNLLAISKGAAVPFPANLVAIVTILAALASSLSNVKTLTTSYTQFADGGPVDRAKGQGGYHRGPSHAAGGKIIEVEGGEFETNTHATQIFLRELSWMNEQGLRKRRGMPFSTSLKDFDSSKMPRVLRPAYRFQTGGFANPSASQVSEVAGQVKEGNESLAVLTQIRDRISALELKIVVPEITKAQAKISDRESRAQV